MNPPVFVSDYTQEIERLRKQIKSMEDKIKELEIEIKDKDERIRMILDALNDC